MAIKLVSNYAKRLGLPGYSSHQFSVSVETELTDLSQVPDEIARLYSQLQESVDREIQQTGFVPGHDYGEVTQGHSGNGNGNGDQAPRPNQFRITNGSNGQEQWKCSDKQKQLILKLVMENNLDRDEVESLAVERFGVGVKQLNKLQASGLINELLASCGQPAPNGSARNGAGAAATSRKGGGR
jgi:hypothetical protein